MGAKFVLFEMLDGNIRYVVMLLLLKKCLRLHSRGYRLATSQFLFDN